MIRANIFLVRHGETEYNREFRVQGCLDVPLNERGIAQAKAIAARLSAEKPSVVVSSPLLRAAATADCIADHTHPRPLRVVVDGLREISFGSFEGIVSSDQSRPEGDQFRRVWKRWEEGDMEASMPDGETPATVSERAWRALLEIVQTHAPESASPVTIAVVGHGRCLRILLARILGVPVGKVQLANVALSLIR